MSRPSEPLLTLLRDTLKKRGLSTAELAAKAGMDRAQLKRALAGQDDLTVDSFLQLAQALDMQQEVAGLVKLESEDLVAGTEVTPLRRDDSTIDPLSEPAPELVKAGFQFGLDMFLQFDVRQLVGSGVPESVLRNFPETLPIRLESRWHRHNKPKFEEDSFTVTLSFDALRDCTFPWSALRMVQFTLPEMEPKPAPPPEPEAKAPARPMLRLVKE